MCGNTKAPSLVGRIATLTAVTKIGSRNVGPLIPGVKVRIDEEVETDEQQAQQYADAFDGEESPEHFYRVTVVETPLGQSVPEELARLAFGSVVVFREEFDLDQVQ